MTSRLDLHEDMPSPADAAAAWFGRKRIAGLGEAEQQAFEAWLSEDPANHEAYEALERTWFGVEAMRDDPRLLALREQALRRNTRLRRLFMPGALAAGLLVAVVGGGWFAVTGGHQFQTQAYRTGVGERSTIALPDGSTVTLDTDTVVRTEAVKGRRQVYLDRGQAFFQVAKDASRPFVVNAGGRTVTALGTAFEVRVDAGRFEVTLVEGKVRVEAPVPAQAATSPTAAAPPTRLQATEMVAGTQLLASDDRAWQLQEINAQRETSWTRGQLVFFTEPLSEVVAELNRYSQAKIVLADPALADIPITGTFKPGDNKGFAAAVASYGMASAEPQPDGTIRLAAPAS